MRILFLVAMMLSLTVRPAWTASEDEPSVFFDRSKEGWFWYLNFQPAPQERPAPSDHLPPTMKEMRERAEELLAKAIETPTEANVEAYMSYQQRLTQRAERFARIWQRVLWAHPELDPTVGEPAAAAGQSAMQAQRAAEQDQILRDLAQTGGILYFYKGDCPLCAAEAPLLSNFAETHGFRVIAISLDGTTDPMFPQSRMDHGAAEKLGVKTVPAIFLARPPNEVQRVGTGFLSIEELTRRLIRIARPMPQDADGTSINEREEMSHEDQEGYHLPESDHRITFEFDSPGRASAAAR
jgi:conjugal transfer pilus assembly protein TraF